MKGNVNPILAVVLIVLALFGVGFLSMKLFAGSATGSGQTVRIKPSNPNDPKYRGDPRLAGGGG